MAIKQKLPKVETGYELGADKYGYFSIIQPEEYTINYVKNPVFLSHAPDASYRALGYIYADCDYGYTYDNATAAIKDRDFSITGGGALITPANPALSSCSVYYEITLPAGTYTFSAYYSGGADHEFLLKVTNTGGTVQYGRTSSNYGSGFNSFQRIYTTFTIPSEMDLLLTLTERADSMGKLSPFYTDMWQCEDKPYMTQSFIGQAKVHTHDNKADAYGWWGVPHYSESYRTNRAYESGKIVELSDLGFVLTGIAGLGINPINTVINPVASGGGVFDGSTNAVRTFTLIGRFYGGDLQDVLTKRRDLYELIRPNGRNTYDQPTTLMFRIWDCEKKNWTGQPLFIFCRYVSGLEGALDSETSEDITITFMSEDPYIYSSYIKRYEISSSVTYEQLAADTSKVSPIFMLRDSNGTWTNLEMRLDDPTGLGKHGDLCVVTNILPDGTGGYYVYGTFDTVVYDGATINVNKIFRYNPITDSVSALGTNTKGVADGEIHRVIVTPSGDAFVVGSFTQADGITDTACIAKYKPGANTWHSVSDGITGLGAADPEIFDIEYADDDMIYVSGKFATIDDLGTLPFEGVARMNCGDGEWSMLPVARTMYVNYANGVRLTRLFKRIKNIGYPTTRHENMNTTGFISGSIMTFAIPNINGMAFWDGTETFYTNYRHVYEADAEYPMNPSVPAYQGVIDHARGHFYFIDGNDGAIYKLQFVLPPHTKTNWSYDPSTDPYPQFDTVYTYPERDTPSVYRRMNPPFCRDVLVYNLAFGDSGYGAGWSKLSLAQLRHSELKIINGRLVTSPNFGYGLDAYELDGSNAIPEQAQVPLIWYFPLWKGDDGEFTSMDIYASGHAYSAAFDINFGTGEAFVAVNPGHIFPVAVDDNEINAIVPNIQSVVNNGENAPVHFRITGPASLKSFTNRTTGQSIRMDGHHVPLHGTANVVTLPTNGSSLGEGMDGHMLDSSDVDLRLVPGTNIIYCDLEDTDGYTGVSLIFRERYASIEKAIEYIGG